jgi:ABC-type sugar transport system ATPase subunit
VSALRLDQVSKRFRNAGGTDCCAVRDLSIGVSAGELLVLVGPSGCGKTTTLRLIAGLESADLGDILIGEMRSNDVPPHGRDVAMVFQRDALYPHMTVEENLSFGLKLRGMNPADTRERVHSVAQTLHIAALLNRVPGGLSGGERQRVAIGRALVRKPRILLLDEPFANLDAPLRRELRRELLRLHRENNLTTVLVTHDQFEALALGHRVAVMSEGHIEQIGTPAELRERPATPFVAAFMDTSVI